MRNDILNAIIVANLAAIILFLIFTVMYVPYSHLGLGIVLIVWIMVFLLMIWMK